MKISDLTPEKFAELPLVIEGESKEVRYFGNGKVAIRLKPTIYSYTANRCGIVEGSDILRLRASRVFLKVLQDAGIKHAYTEVTDKYILSDLVMPSEAEFRKYNLPVFKPNDLSEDELRNIPIGPPVEVVVKRFHGGTSKHRYNGMNHVAVRSTHPLYAGMEISAESAYPVPIVRFDWRNPINDRGGKRIADEILPEDIADWFIDINKARATARKVYETLEGFLDSCNIICNDICLFIAEDGETVYGEISQDCGRFRHFDLGSLDKDVWRAGGSSQEVLAKWKILLDMIEQKKEKK